MGLFHGNLQGRRHILQFLIVNLVCLFFGTALAQVDAIAKAFDSLNFPMEAITCLVNLLILGVTLVRGGLDLDNAAREVLTTLNAPELETVNGSNGMGLTTICKKQGGQGETPDSTGGGREYLQTASVVMLSKGTPNCSMKQFMKSNAVDDVQSILLQYQPLNDAIKNGKVSVTSCVHSNQHNDRRSDRHNDQQSDEQCKCIVFSTLQEITDMLARRMPGTLKTLSNSMCLLPCRKCLKNYCHRPLHVPDQLSERLTEGDPRVDLVCEILDETAAQSMDAKEPMCICIPTHDARRDKWTEVLIRTFKSKDAEARGVTDKASESMQQYLDEETGRGNRAAEQEYSIGSFIWPRFLEILINIALTFWFKVDGFSSAFVARRAVRNYLVDSKGSGLAANTFLTKAIVRFNAHNNQICQVLTFRSKCCTFRNLSFIAGGVNYICFIGWTLLIAFEFGDSAPLLSPSRVYVIIAAICIACVMDCWHMFWNTRSFGKNLDWKVLSLIICEIACVVAGIVATTLAKNVCGNWEYEHSAVPINWVYSALQVLVWAKWGVGSYILDEYSRESPGYTHDDRKVLVFSSAFWLNAVLAGVRSKWEPSWPWKRNYLFNYLFPYNASHPPPIQC